MDERRSVLAGIALTWMLGACNTPAPVVEGPRWQPLIVPGTFEGWHTAPGGEWRWEDDVLIGTNSKSESRHGLLISDETYGDFQARFSFRTVSGCSGFYFRVEEDETATGVSGVQAENNSQLVPGIGARWSGFEPNGPGLRSATRRVSVPSLVHSSRPLTPSLAVK